MEVYTNTPRENYIVGEYTSFWNVTICILVDVCSHFEAALSPFYLLGLFLGPEDGSSIFLRNVGNILPECKKSHPRG
jgi:hypothetical protein